MLALVALSRKVYWCVEQPGSSKLPAFPYLEPLVNFHSESVAESLMHFFARWCEGLQMQSLCNFLQCLISSLRAKHTHLQFHGTLEGGWVCLVGFLPNPLSDSEMC
jgi:hypothetical protein